MWVIEKQRLAGEGELSEWRGGRGIGIAGRIVSDGRHGGGWWMGKEGSTGNIERATLWK